jgi:chromosome undetermined scaffold_180, whole genome shotgun sequence|nr:MAG TPA: STRUCTURAL MAINTENANCE OF CHROMOSOMES PROTEIN [Caudoviricetes sp.]
MKINYLKFKSMFAYSPEMQTINFTDPTQLYTLIIGKNGRGKSSITKILNIALYFSCDGIPMGEFANEINGDGYVEVSVDSYGSSWTIISEYSTTKLKSLQVFKNGELQDWGGIKTTKEKVAQTIIDIPQKLFNNIINLSVNDFKSFLSLSAKDSKEIRDKIFSFGILNQMALIENQKLLQSKKEVDRIQATMDSLTSTLSSTYEEYRKSEEDFVCRKNEAERLYKEYMSEIESKRNSLLSTKKEIETEIEALRSLEREQTTSHLINATIDISENLNLLQGNLSESRRDIEEKSEVHKSTENTISALKYLLDVKEYEKSLYEIEKLSKLHKEEENKLALLKIELLDIENAREKNRELLSDKQSKLDEILLSISKENALLGKYESKLQIHTALLKIRSKFETDEALSSFIESKERSLDFEKKEHESLQNRKTLLLQESKNLRERLRHIETGKDTCPTCGSPVDSIKKIEEIQNKISKNEEHLRYVEEQIPATHSKILSTEKSLLQLGEIKAKKEMMEQHYEADPIHLFSLNEFLSLNIEDEIKKIKDKISSLTLSSQKIKEEIKSTEDTELEQKYKELLSYSQTYTENKSRYFTQIESIKSMNMCPVKEEYFEMSDEFENILSSLSDVINLKERYQAEVSKLSNLSLELSSLSDRKITLESKISSLSETMVKNKELLSTSLKDFTLPTKKILIDDSVKERIKDKENELSSLTSSFTDIENTENSLLLQVKNIEIEHKSKEEYIKSSINRIETEIENFKKQTEVILHENHLQEAFLRTLSDDGLKSYIMSKIVPYLNQEINSFISRFNINVTVEFDSEFVGTLHRNGHCPSLQSISTGQRKIIDVCILLSITKFFIKKYPDINLVFYDEIFSSLDTENSPTILKLIKQEFCENLGITVCLVSHSFVNPTLIDRFISVEDKNYFSSLNILSREDYTRQYS